MTVTADPRLLARFRDGRWRIAGGVHTVALARAADDLGVTADAVLEERAFGR